MTFNFAEVVIRGQSGVLVWFLGELGVILVAILRTILTTHGHSVLIQWVEGKLHCPLPVWYALVLVPTNSPVSSNPLQSILSLLEGFFRWSIISQPLAYRLRNASGIVDSFILATFAFSLALFLRRFRDVD